MNFPITSSSGTGDIKELQQALADSGAGIAVDGIFGPKTATAIKVFQVANGLVADGIAGPATWAKLTAPAPAPEIAAGRMAGFDTFAYPGDSAMQAWRQSSPYRFVGYYLKAPCHGMRRGWGSAPGSRVLVGAWW